MALVVLIDRAGFRLAADRAVVKQEEVQLVEHASSLLEATAREAARAASEARSAAENEGYVDGYQAGRQDAAAVLTSQALARRSVVEQLEPVLVQMVVESVAAVLQRVGRERLVFESLAAVREVIRRAQWAVLRVPPAQLESAQRALDLLNRETGGAGVVQALADPELTDDECVLETDSGVVDAGLGTLMQSVRSAVTTALHGSVLSGPATDARPWELSA
jgi:type III secretion protein L